MVTLASATSGVLGRQGCWVPRGVCALRMRRNAGLCTTSQQLHFVQFGRAEHFLQGADLFARYGNGSGGWHIPRGVGGGG